MCEVKRFLLLLALWIGWSCIDLSNSSGSTCLERDMLENVALFLSLERDNVRIDGGVPSAGGITSSK